MDRRVALALLCASLIGTAFAAQEVEVKYWFPENPTTEFLPGKDVKAILGLHNSGSNAVNVSYAAAQLASPYDAKQVVFNFTTQASRQLFLNNVELSPGQEASVDYALHFPAQLPPRDFLLKLFLFTSEADQFQQHLVFNQTVYVIEPATWFDTQLLGLYAIGIALLALIGYTALSWAKSKGYIKKTRKSKLTKSASGPSDKSDYLKGTHGAEFLRKRSTKAAE